MALTDQEIEAIAQRIVTDLAGKKESSKSAGPSLDGETSPDNGTQAWLSAGGCDFGATLLAKGRLGSSGQTVNLHINGRETPWIQTNVRIQVDSSDQVHRVQDTYSIFPTHSFYERSRFEIENAIPASLNAAESVAQSNPETFIALGASASDGAPAPTCPFPCDPGTCP